MKKLSEYNLEEITEQEPKIIAELLDKWQHIKKTGEALEARAKALLTEGKEIPNWTLKSGSKRTSIGNVKTAVDLVLENKDLQVSPTDLLDICTISPSKLSDVISTKTGESKKKSKELMELTLGDVLVVNETQPSLKREK